MKQEGGMGVEETRNEGGGDLVLPNPTLFSGAGKGRVCSRLLQSSSGEEAVWGSSGLQCSVELPGPEQGGLRQRDSPQLSLGERLFMGTFSVRKGLGTHAGAQGKKVTGTVEEETELTLMLRHALAFTPFPLSCG